MQQMTYKTTPDGPLTVDVFAPEGEQARPRPAILFFHGGGWTGGAPGQFHPFGEALVERGAVVMSFAYRLLRSDNEAPVAAMQDAQDAVRWTLEQADEMGVDPTRLVIGGGSAGGHLALTTLFAVGDHAEEPASARPIAVVLFNPVLDVVEGWEAGRKRLEQAGVEPRDFSPAHQIRPGMPATIVFQGDADETTPVMSARTYRDRMLEAGNACVLVEYEGRGHGFFNAGRSREDFEDVLSRTITFLESLNVFDPAE